MGSCLEVLKDLPDKIVNTCVTSPPYYGLRDYGVSGQLGLEKTPEEYIEKLVLIFREVKRVLRDDGTLWLNLGDSYSGSGKGRESDGFKKNGGKQGTNKGTINGMLQKTSVLDLKPKNLIGIPWRVAFALQADGWYLRQDIIWNKPSPMPESVKDRCTKSHEYIFLLSKNPKYYYDSDAIKEPITDTSVIRLMQNIDSQKSSDRAVGKSKNMKAMGSTKSFDKSQGGGGSSFVGHSGYKKADGTLLTDGFRNKRDVWTVPTKPYKEAHFAVYPEELIQPCILAGCPESGVVLDPFGGSGTTAFVSKKYARNYILIELNPEYKKIADKRLSNIEYSLFLEEG